ncbi:MAG: hypothetical protein WCI27_07580 [Candidatus Omnitrophota bacterium]
MENKKTTSGPKLVNRKRIYAHSEPSTYEEAVDWLVKEVGDSDILETLTHDLANHYDFHRFAKFFIPRELSNEEEVLRFSLYVKICGYKNAGKPWEWIDLLKGAFTSLGDEVNVEKVDAAIIAEFGNEDVVREGELEAIQGESPEEIENDKQTEVDKESVSSETKRPIISLPVQVLLGVFLVALFMLIVASILWR